MKIKFYSKSDMASGMQMNKCLAILDEFDSATFEIKNLNDCLEYYNLLKYDDAFGFDNKYRDTLKQLKSTVHKFIKTCDIPMHLNEIDFDYHDDFWELFEKDKLYKKYNFESISEYAKDHIELLLSHKDIVAEYNDQLVDYLSNQDDAAELLVKSDIIDNGITLYFPDGLDKKYLIEKYANSNKANLNCLNTIYTAKNIPLDYLNDEIRVRAIENYKKIYEERKDSFHRFSYNVSISFEEKLDKPLIYDKHGSKYIVKYSLDVNTESIIFRILSTVNKNEYFVGACFELGEDINIASIYNYDFILIENGLSLEKLIKWYFEKYIVYEFSIQGFTFNISQSNNYIEKTRNLCAELDGLLKQYNNYCDSGSIDRSIIEYSSASMNFENIGSLINDKYSEIIDKALCGYSVVLCSDQSVAVYIDGYGKNTLYDNLISHDIKKSDINNASIDYVNELIRESVIEEKNGYLKVTELGELLHQWFHKKILLTNDAIKYIDNSKLKKSTCLFSKPEIDYFNYSLKDAPFSNCLGIRNKYMHGTNSLNEDTNRSDYYKVLLLTLYTVLKINDELVRKNED